MVIPLTVIRKGKEDRVMKGPETDFWIAQLVERPPGKEKALGSWPGAVEIFPF